MHDHERVYRIGLLLIGVVVYLAQLLYRAFTQVSILDEGGYLYVGYQFAIGVLTPFQDYGPWNNQMPLAFLIPGMVQRLFGLGLFTGRMYAVTLAMAMLAGLWLCAKRLGGRWAGVLAVWALPVSVIASKMYSEALTQALAAALLVWMMAFAIGEERGDWELVVAGVLGGALVMTRFNLVPALALTVMYVWWLRGGRAGLRPALVIALSAAVVIVGLHALYWPNILRIWAFWLPSRVFPFLAPFAPPEGFAESWQQVTGWTASLSSLRLAFRSQLSFIALFFAGCVMFVQPEWRVWDARRKTAALLIVMYTVLLGLHIYASVLGDYCVFCLNAYLGFFNPITVLLLATVWPKFREGKGAPSRWADWLVVGFMLLFGLSAFEFIGRTFVAPGSIRTVVELPIPRLGSGGLLGGTIPLWGLLENAYGMDFRQASGAVTRIMRLSAGVLAGLALGFGILALRKRAAGWLTGWGVHTPHAQRLSIFLLVAALLAPSAWAANSFTQYDCRGNTIAGFERVGAQLAERIPEGANVYWIGGRSPVLMLYLPGRNFHPQQVNGAYTFKVGGDSDALLRYGFYNEATAIEWLYAADYVLVEEDLLEGWIAEQLAADEGFEVRFVTEETTACYSTSQVLVYQYTGD